ncbi:hypothetical protein HNR62_002592 [Oceanisphaera litoralis]|nr:hypothetical protein [Oceanisphaera litoralis]MBM7456694.1 hypothetical protein [Oceanisphaera litoralis]
MANNNNSNNNKGWLWFAGLYLAGVLAVTLAGMAIKLAFGI